MEISAKNGENVMTMFNTMGEILVEEYLPIRRREKARYSLTLSARSLGSDEDKKCKC